MKRYRYQYQRADGGSKRLFESSWEPEYLARVAEDAAAHEFDPSDWGGYPATFTIFDESGDLKLGEFEVDMRPVPEFTAKAKGESDAL